MLSRTTKRILSGGLATAVVRVWVVGASIAVVTLSSAPLYAGADGAGAPVTGLEVPANEGVELTLLDAVESDDVLRQIGRDLALSGGAGGEVQLAWCRTSKAQLADGQWHAAPGGRIRRLEGVASAVLVAALPADSPVPDGDGFWVYFVPNDEGADSGNEAQVGDEPVAADDRSVLESVAALRASGVAPQAAAAMSILLQEKVALSFNTVGARVKSVYGAELSRGATAEESADAFALGQAEVFSASPDELFLSSHFDGGNVVRLGWEPESESYRLMLFVYEQRKDGIPVEGAELRVLVRNDEDYPAVLAESTLKDVRDFIPTANIAAAPNVILAHGSALELTPGLVEFGEPEFVIWAGREDEVESPRLAIKFTGKTDPESDSFEHWRYFVDATSGEIIHRENLIHPVTITGTISGQATTGNGSDNCAAEAARRMPYAEAEANGVAVFADANGNFSLTVPGTPPGVNFPMRGRYFRVDNVGGGEGAHQQGSLSPMDFVHNSRNTDELVRAQVNAYIHANVVRDFVLAENPSYPTISTQTNFLVKVNRSDGLCPRNAWWAGDGSSINFCRASGTAPNTAFSGVVHHEYGHHVVWAGHNRRNGGGPYGEGMADCIAVLIADAPLLGAGWNGTCTTGLRTANNTVVFDPANCSSIGDESHDCGNVLSGAVWHTRNALRTALPGTYLSIIRRLTIESIPLHSGEQITPLITRHFLTLDDEMYGDGNLNNGTPHYAQIAAGFGQHRLLAVPVNVAATRGTRCDGVRLTWNTVPGATGYKVYRNGAEIRTVGTNSFTDTGVSVRAYSGYTVRATFGSIASELSASVTGWRGETPAAPLSVTATDAVHCNKVVISWSSVVGAVSYEVYRSTSPSSGFVRIGTDTASPYDDTTAIAGTLYYYKVKAIGCAAGPLSNADAGRRSAVPATSSAIGAVDACSSIRVAWSSVSGASEYQLYRSSSATGTFAPLGPRTRDAFYNDASAAENTAYYYKVKAIDVCNQTSGFSPVAQGRRNVPPPAPSITVTGLCNGISVNWNAVNGAVRYEVYRSESQSGPFGPIGSAMDIWPYFDRTAVAGRSYWYKVRGASNCRPGSFSSAVSGRISTAGPPAPGAPNASDGTLCDRVRISWAAVSGGSAYEVQRSRSTGGPYEVIHSGTAAVSFDDTSALPGVTYYYKVRARNACNTWGPLSSYNAGYRRNCP